MMMNGILPTVFSSSRFLCVFHRRGPLIVEVEVPVDAIIQSEEGSLNYSVINYEISFLHFLLHDSSSSSSFIIYLTRNLV